MVIFHFKLLLIWYTVWNRFVIIVIFAIIILPQMVGKFLETQ